MAIFQHGQTWWFEYRRRKPATRVVKNTGIRLDDPDGRSKADQVFAAFKMGIGLKPKKSAMESILEAIYGGGSAKQGIPVSTIWSVYEDWFNGKRKKVSRSTWTNTRNETARLMKWCEERNATDISDVSVSLARQYVAHISDGRSNKTVRNIVLGLSKVWTAVGQIHQGVHNPWQAACPDDDGSSVRRPDFTAAQADAVLTAAKELGHDWYLASMIALYTGLRYGDVATLQWEKVDFSGRTLTTTPHKTKHSSGVEVTIPLAEPLYALLKDGGEGFVLPEHGVRYEARSRLPVQFSQVLERAGLKGTAHTFHSWRHTANSRMAEAGVPSEVRQMLCGWTNDEMARHYDHSKHLKELTDAVGKI